jgi:hypothetical protein
MIRHLTDSDYDDDEMDQRCAYVDEEILFMCWNPRKDGWVPDMDIMREHRNGNLRIYQPVDTEDYLVTMPGHILWPVKFDGADILEVLEKPWVAAALQGMQEDEIDELDAYRITEPNPPAILRVGIRIDAPLTIRALDLDLSLDLDNRYNEELAAAVLASLSSYRPRPTVRPESRPPALPKHIQEIVLERAEIEGKTCPITLTPIRKTTGSVTSCGHIFQTGAIQEWMSDNQTCPECRQICSI